jgi:hypothetical protein
MLLYIGLGLLGSVAYVTYRNTDNIKNTFEIYKGFKKTIDPEGKKGHLKVALSFIGIAALRFMIAYKMGKLKTDDHKDIKDNERFNRDYIKISYTYKDKPYCYLLKIPKGVMPLTSIVDETGTNVEDTITPYLGPNLDCHGTTICPKDFGYEKLICTTAFDDIVIFMEDDTISF